MVSGKWRLRISTDDDPINSIEELLLIKVKHLFYFILFALFIYIYCELFLYANLHFHSILTFQ